MLKSMKTVFVFAFVFCTATGHDLKCYQCISTKSWDDCAHVKVVKHCVFGQDRCFLAISSYHKEGMSISSFSKGCISEAQCADIEKYCKRKGFECIVSCCSGDLCNNAALLKSTGTNSRAMGQVVSVIALLACAMVAFVR
ncbi:hypothetical protein ACROYT_G008370 [Oculina patagonica]